MAADHAQDDIRGTFLITVGEVTEENAYFKVRVGNNKEDVDQLKGQVNSECGASPDNQTIWAFVGQDISDEKLPDDQKHPAKDGGFWINLGEAGVADLDDLFDFTPTQAIDGELFAEMSIATNGALKDGCFDSMSFRISLDGSHEFAKNFTLFMMKKHKAPIHEKLVLSAVKKLKEFDLTIKLNSMKEFSENREEGALNSRVPGADSIYHLAEHSLALCSPTTLDQALSSGIRLVIFINDNMYANLELKGQGVLDYLQQ